MKKPFKLLLTLAAGASIGMLFAPKKGKELRKSIAKSKNLDPIKEAFLDASRDASEEVKKFMESEEFQDFMEDAKDRIDDLAELAKEHTGVFSEKAKKEFDAIIKKAKKEFEPKKVKKKAQKVVKDVKKKISK
ncbi:MAG: YtxH domain-containing protein [Candidatus Gracilibacteria bacterium]|jgi:gas vesicle protein|nr:YtxH domain-containing protein [Candidatus Gracilibacteria bacterium]